MSSPETEWVLHQRSFANPKGRRQGDLPLLLRQVAKEIERIDGAQVQDLVLHSDVTNRGDWYSVTVYYLLPDESAERGNG